eukprot:gene20564-22587_t
MGLKSDGREKIVQDFESFDPGQSHISEASNQPCNKVKNRYPNLQAYDHTRVVLQFTGEMGSDYLNANYIDVICIKIVRTFLSILHSTPKSNLYSWYCQEKAFIATQGPMTNTVADFWRACWENKTGTIVMVTKLEERGRIVLESAELAAIVIYSMLERIKNEQTVDIYGYVTMLRSQRNFMVQNDEQYIFVHNTILDAIQSSSTAVPASEFSTYLKTMSEFNKHGDVLIERDFSVIVYATVPNNEDYIMRMQSPLFGTVAYFASTTEVKKSKNRLASIYLLSYNLNIVNHSMTKIWIKDEEKCGYLKKMESATQDLSSFLTYEDSWMLLLWYFEVEEDK